MSYRATQLPEALVPFPFAPVAPATVGRWASILAGIALGVPALLLASRWYSNSASGETRIEAQDAHAALILALSVAITAAAVASSAVWQEDELRGRRPGVAVQVAGFAAAAVLLLDVQRGTDWGTQMRRFVFMCGGAMLLALAWVTMRLPRTIVTWVVRSEQHDSTAEEVRWMRSTYSALAMSLLALVPRLSRIDHCASVSSVDTAAAVALGLWIVALVFWTYTDNSTFRWLVATYSGATELVVRPERDPANVSLPTLIGSSAPYMILAQRQSDGSEQPIARVPQASQSVKIAILLRTLSTWTIAATAAYQFVVGASAVGGVSQCA